VLSTSLTTSTGSTNLQVKGSENLTLSGRFAIHTNTMFFTINNSALTTLAGVITNVTANSAGIYKQGPGTMIISGNNTYGGVTTVGEGILLVNNTSGSGTSTGAVTVLPAATLGGTGTIANTVTVQSGGHIGAGSSAGILTLQNGLDLGAGGTCVWELAANSTANPGTDFDQIALTGGNLVLGGSSRLLINFTGTSTFPDATNSFWQQTRSWTIIAGSGSAANPGPTDFAIIDGTNGVTAGVFSTAAAGNGTVVLTFTPTNSLPPAPVIDPNIVGAGTGNAQLSWSSQAGASYTVEFKTNITQTGWLFLTNLTATGTTTTIADQTTPVPAERYYRVVSP
jgi:autotransporter-associated beta strand protein